MIRVIPVWTVEYKCHVSEELKSFRVNADDLSQVLEHFQRINHGVDRPIWLRVTKEAS